VARGIFQGDIEAKGGEVGVEDAGGIAFVLGNGVLAGPVRRDTGEEADEQLM
jgi:hypothetical protein